MADAPPLIWVDGRIVGASEFRIDPSAEGLGFGLGVFTTTRTWNRKRIWFWREHHERLMHSAPKVGVPLSAKQLPTEADLLELVRRCDANDLIVRVAAAKQGRSSLVWATTRQLPAPTEGIRLHVSSCRISRLDPFASIKCFHYGLRQLAFGEAAEAGADDALLLDTADEVLETSRSNLFLRLKEGWATPSLDGAVLDGVVRSKVLGLLDVRQRRIRLEELRDVQEAFATNSGRGVVPIVQIGEWKLEIGDATNEMQRLISSAAAGDG